MSTLNKTGDIRQFLFLNGAYALSNNTIEIAALVATVKEKAAQIQKVSAQLEASNVRREWSTIPKVVARDQLRKQKT